MNTEYQTSQTFNTRERDRMSLVQKFQHTATAQDLQCSYKITSTYTDEQKTHTVKICPSEPIFTLPSVEMTEKVWERISYTSFLKDEKLILPHYTTNYSTNPPPPPPDEFKILSLPPIQLNEKGWGDIQCTVLLEDEICITRPLKELVSHLKHFKLPRLELIARCIKTLVLSIFRWHFCDSCFLKRGETIHHSLSGKASESELKDFKSYYPYMLENAYILTLKEEVIQKQKTLSKNTENPPKKFDEFEREISPDSIRKYFQIIYEIEITKKLQNNSIYDLFQSTFFDLNKSLIKA